MIEIKEAEKIHDILIEKFGGTKGVYLSKTIVSKIDSWYKAGVKDFILTGHSQGGGILLCSMLTWKI